MFCGIWYSLGSWEADGHQRSRQGRGRVGGGGLLVAARCWVAAELVG